MDNEATIRRLYDAFARLDAETMAACYAPDARLRRRGLLAARRARDRRHVEDALQRHPGQGRGGLEARRTATCAPTPPAAAPTGMRTTSSAPPAAWSTTRSTRASPSRRRPDREPARPLRFLALVAPGARRAGPAAGLVADAQEEGARHRGRRISRPGWRARRRHPDGEEDMTDNTIAQPARAASLRSPHRRPAGRLLRIQPADRRDHVHPHRGAAGLRGPRRRLGAGAARARPGARGQGST